MADETLTVEQTPQGVSPDHLMLADSDTTKGPRMSIGTVAKIFFGKSHHSLRRWENAGYLTLDGRPVAIRRGENKHRQYTLTDVEEMAHALAQHNIINGEQLSRITVILVNIAAQWDYLEVTYDSGTEEGK